MNSLIHGAISAAVGLVVFSLTPHLASSTVLTDTPLIKSTTTTSSMQVAQRGENPSFMFRNKNSGATHKKKSKKK